MRSSKFAGYEQRSADGINISPKKFSVEFLGLRDSKADDLISFLRATKGVNSFDWTPPNESSGKYVCRTFGRSKPELNVNNISATFEQVFGE